MSHPGYPPPGSNEPTQRLSGFDPGYRPPASSGTGYPEPPAPTPSGGQPAGTGYPAAPPAPGAPVWPGQQPPPSPYPQPTYAQTRPMAMPGPSFPQPPKAPERRKRGSAGLLVAAGLVGLLAGLLGGGGGALLVNQARQNAPVPQIPAPQVNRPDGSVAKIAAQTLPSVVTLKVKGGGAAGTGSGFVIDDKGHILTNNHVIAAAASSGQITVEFNDGSSVSGQVVGRDASYDLAVVKVDRPGLTPLAFGKSADVVVGDPVIAVGAPLGLDSTVTTGIVSALNRPVAAGSADDTSYINAIQTDAAINPGNSGGPLLDLSGKVVGVNSAIARIPSTSGGTGGSIGVGFAIPSDQAVKTANQLITTGKAVHPIIGVRLDRAFDGDGARIASGGVTPGSGAAAAGLRDGDVVVAFEGRKVTTPEQLIVLIRARDVGDTVRLTVERNGQRSDLALTLQAG